LILKKIIKIVVTRSQILRLKCTKFDFGWGSTLNPAGGAYKPPSWIKGGLLQREGKGNGREGRDKRGRAGRGRGKGRKGRKERGREFGIYNF